MTSNVTVIGDSIEYAFPASSWYAKGTIVRTFDLASGRAYRVYWHTGDTSRPSYQRA